MGKEHNPLKSVIILTFQLWTVFYPKICDLVKVKIILKKI
jgi:hypothetical protein